MIQISRVEVSGVSEAGPFHGSLEFGGGLRVISAENHYGKSLAVNSVAWCLGLERMFGLQDNDPSRLPLAVREVIDLEGAPGAHVRSSEVALTITRGDGGKLRLRRQIVGDPTEVGVDELLETGDIVRTSRLYARKHTMKDATGGLQHFLFEWAGLPRAPVMTIRGDPSEVYLENLAPLFFIDQNEGWTDLQALQVYRYGLQDIAQVSVEYLLGAADSLEARLAEQAIVAHEESLKAAAVSLAFRVVALFEKQGWIVNWSSRGASSEVARRWSQKALADLAREEFHFDLSAEQQRLRTRAVALRKTLASGTLDSMDTAASSDSSQDVVELKSLRHSLREELRLVRAQTQDQQQLGSSLEHRIASAKDVLRLKRDGIGRLETSECPTCHRVLEPSTFNLSSQSTHSVEAHIEALMRDRALVVRNVDATEAQAIRVAAELGRVEEKLASAERALAIVNSATGAVREQLAKAATDLAALERELDKNEAIGKELADLQVAVDHWVSVAQMDLESATSAGDLPQRRQAFEAALARLLRALGHSAVTPETEVGVRLDETYIPYLGPRRLRSLGSASDHARLVAGYVLALAEASQAVRGSHPGFVLLDEPLQQNPDPAHRDLFLRFLEGTIASRMSYQTLVFTSLRTDEITRLRAAGVHVQTPQDRHFLTLRDPT